MSRRDSRAARLAVPAALLLASLGYPTATAGTMNACVIPITHRAVHGPLYDEETLGAIRTTATYGPAEIDVHVTADSKLVVIHDANVKRTTNGQGMVHEMTLDQIQALRTTKTWSTIPTLAQAVHAAIRQHSRLVVELKRHDEWTPELFTYAANLSRRAAAHHVRVFLGGMYAGFERDIPAYGAESIYWRPGLSVAPTPENAAAVEADMVMTGVDRITAAQVTALEQAGYITALRLTNDFVAARQLGVKYALTNHPNLASMACT